MEREDSHTQANKQAESEHHSEKPTAQWKEGFIGAWHDFSPKYLSNLIFLIVGLLAAPLFGVLMKNPKSTVYGAAISITIIIWLFAYYLAQQVGQSPKADNQSTPAPVKPEGKQPQLEEPTFREQTETVRFSYGESGMTTTFSLAQLQQRPHAPIFLNSAPIALVYAEGKKLYVDAKLGDLNAPVVEIKRNQFTSPPPHWDRNSNQTALEIVDEKQIPVFQLYYKTPTHIVINGIFKHRNDLYFISKLGVLMNPSSEEQATKFLLKRIFKYPAWKYPGTLDESGQ